VKSEKVQTFRVASDARLKTDVSSLDELRRQRPQMGFIAQEVVQLFPQWVAARDGYKTIGIEGF